MNLYTITLPLIAATTTLAQAGGISTFDNRADFNLNTGAQTIETFESESLGDLALPTIFDSGLGVSIPSGSVSSYIEAGDPQGYASMNSTIGGRNYLAFGRTNTVPGAPPMVETGSYSTEFTFGASVNAFGFDLSGAEFQNAAQGFNVTTFINGQIMDDFFYPSDQLYGLEFYGIVSDSAFDAIRINIPVLNSGTADYVAFDDVTWVAKVPSPSALSLLGLGGLVASRRRR